MKEENNLLRKVGKKEHFRVPDRYFEDFSKELMNNLPEKETFDATQEITMWQRVKPWLYMTAMFCGIMLSVKLFVGDPQQEEFISIPPIEAESLTDEDWKHLIDQSMIDDYSLYELLTDTENNINY